MAASCLFMTPIRIKSKNAEFSKLIDFYKQKNAWRQQCRLLVDGNKGPSVSNISSAKFTRIPMGSLQRIDEGWCSIV